MPRFQRHKWREYAMRTFERYDHDRPERLALDTETTGLTWQDRPFGMTIAWQGPDVIEKGWFELGNDNCRSLAWDLIFEHRREGQFVFFNAKFDIRMLNNFDMWDTDLHYSFIDVLPMVALMEPVEEHKLKYAMRKYLGMTTTEEEAVKRYKDKHNLGDVGYHLLPRELIVPYALKDAVGTLMLGDYLELKVAEKGLQGPLEKEQRLITVMLNMERRGLKVVPSKLKAAAQECDRRILAAKLQIETLTSRKVGTATKKVRIENGLTPKTKKPAFKTIEVPDDFNPNSPPQLLAMLQSRGHKVTSSRRSVLENLDDPLAEWIIKLRGEEKLRSTYILPLLKERDENDIVHPNLNPHGTGTGRFSSGAVKAF